MNITSIQLRKKHTTIEELMKKQINLYPYKGGRLTGKQRRMRIYIFGSFIVAFGILSSTAYFFVQNRMVLSEIASKTANIQIEQERLHNQQMLDLLMDRIEYKETLLSHIDQTHASATLIFEMIERNVPNNIQYINLDFVSEEVIRISCKTDDQEWIAKLIHQLKAENFFSNVFVESISYDKDLYNASQKTEYEFQLICTFGGATDETQK